MTRATRSTRVAAASVSSAASRRNVARRRATSWRTDDDDAITIHRQVVKFVFGEMGADAALASVTCASSGGEATPSDLDQVLTRARAKFAPYVSERTIKKWFYFFVKFGVTQPEDSLEKRAFSDPYPRSVRRTPAAGWTSHHTRALKDVLDDDSDLYLDEIQERLCDATGDLFTAPTIWRRLCEDEDVGYTVKGAVDAAKQQEEDERRRYQKCLNDIIVRPEQLIYLDEIFVGFSAPRPRRVWFRRDWVPFPTEPFACHRTRYTLIAACGVNGFIMSSCEIVEREHGANDPDESRGMVDRERFRTWVVQRLVPVLGKATLLEDRSIVVMNDTTVHLSDEIEQLIESTGARLIYLPRYSPDLNPITSMLGHYDKYLRQHGPTQPSWTVLHIEGLLSVSRELARAMFQRSGVPNCWATARTDAVARRTDDRDEELAALIIIILLLARRWNR